MELGAVLQDVVALHVALHRGLTKVSVSTQIAVLRRLLLGSVDSKFGDAFKAASKACAINIRLSNHVTHIDSHAGSNSTNRTN